MTMAADLLSVLLHANLAIGAAVLLVLGLRLPVRSLFGARAAYALWLIAPLAMIAAMLPARTITAPAPPPPQPVAPAHAPAATSPSIPMAPAASPTIMGQRAAPSLPLDDILVAAWVLVALLAAGVQAERQRRFVRSLGRLSGRAGLYHAERDGIGPAVIGAFSPKVVLPADFAVRFTADEQALILAHERSHLSTGDAQINALTTALQCLFWFNPLVHLGAHRLRVDQEIACDAAVLLRFPVARRIYGEAMLKTQLAPFAPPLGCHWPASAHTHLKERFVMLNQHRQGRLRRLAGGGAVAALALGAGFAVWAAQPAHVIHAAPDISRHDAARDRASPLYKAVQNGDLERARALIAAGAKIDFKSTGDGTPLIVAARDGRADLVTLLLDAGANPNLSVRGDGAPLLAAAQAGHGDIARTLVERGADVDTYVRGDGTPLINAIRAGDLTIIGYLIDKGADVNAPAPGDGSPLIEAVHTGRAAVIDLLLAKGANAGMPVQGDGDPLIAAAASGRLDLVKTLVEHGASVESFVPGDETPLINAAQSGDLATVAYLVDKGADVNRAVPANRGETRSPLGEAAKHGHRAVVDYLKAKGARA
jgi:beta-lactamase regulating signal transducer with metallopeptidase domain/ankyrin repeat protein